MLKTYQNEIVSYILIYVLKSPNPKHTSNIANSTQNTNFGHALMFSDFASRMSMELKKNIYELRD